MSRFSHSPFFSCLSAACTCLSVLAAGSGCGKSKDGGNARTTSEEVQPASQPAVPPPAAPPPLVIHLSFQEDPGFRVPLEVMEKFESFNRLLPGEMRSAASWASLKLTMADGTVVVVDAPNEKFGEAGYDLRDAEPGMKLVAFDKQTEAIKASWGPLASIHVMPTEAANSKPKAFPILVDGKELAVDPEQLASLPMVPEPTKRKDAWKLELIVDQVSPGCVLGGLSVSNKEESLKVNAEQLGHTYLRANRRGSWMFSVAPKEGEQAGKLVRGVTRIEASCKAPRAK